MADDNDDGSCVSMSVSEDRNTQNVAPILSANTEAMIAHLMMLFGRARQGRIEITAIHADKTPHRSPRTKFFSTDETEDAAAFAAIINADPGWNIYVGAALRVEEVFPGKAADDEDFLETYALWADADDGEQMAKARQTYRDLLISPAMVVVTGRTPSTRAQLWWPLESPISDIAALRSALRGIASVLGTDPKVCTGKQLMRLAGSVSWPKQGKPDRVLERTEIIEPTGAHREFMVEQIARAFPPINRIESGEISDVTVAPAGALGLQEVIEDGREGYAFRLIRAMTKEFIGTTGCEPSADDLYKFVAPTYFRKVSQSRAGRGSAFLKQKCIEAVRAFHEGKIPGAETLELAVVNWANRHPEPIEDDDEPSEETELRPGFPLLSIEEIKALPEAEWIVEDIIPKNGLGFIYGAPGSYKSFLCYDLALSLAYGLKTWMDKPIRHEGYVIYIASEGSSGVKTRIIAWQAEHGIEADDGKFRLLRTPLSFMRPDDVSALELTVQSVVDELGPVGTIFVDTVSRVLPGADENLQKDVTLFVGACDGLRDKFGCSLLGVHHTNKGGEMRGSTVFLGQGDVVLRLDKETIIKGAKITCEKQKDAEDGWERSFEVEKKTWLTPGRIKESSSLIIKFFPPERVPVQGQLDWPSRPVCKEILKLIQSAWLAGRPWSPHPRAAPEGRYAARNISALLGLPANVVVMVLDEWLTNQMVVLDTVDGHSKVKGLRVEKWLD